MKRIKTFGVLIGLVFVLSCLFGASAASANTFENPGQLNLNWTGSSAETSHKLSLGAESFICSGVGFSQKYGVAKTFAELKEPVKLECKSGSWNANWQTHGCEYRFLPGATGVVGSLDIVGCEAAMSWQNPVSNCTYEIGNQSSIGTVIYENKEESGHLYITATPNVSALTWTQHCPGGTSIGHNGTYVGSWNIKGYTEAGSQSSVRFGATTTPGPHFAVQTAPATFYGERESGNDNVFNLGRNGSVHCETISYVGTSAVAEPTSVTTSPGFGSCVWWNAERTKHAALSESFVNFGGCSYTFEPGPSSSNGSMTIGGANCASNPLTISIPECVVSVGPNTVSNVSFVNHGEGVWQTITVAFGMPGKFSYTATGAGCGEPGAHTNGWMLNTVIFSATSSLGKAEGLSYVE